MIAHGAEAAKAAAFTIRDRLGGDMKPVAAIVLGSGLGELADRIENASRVRYADIPGFHTTHVAGHKGELIRGTLGGREILALAGRFHMYEGHTRSVPRCCLCRMPPVVCDARLGREI